MLWHTENNLVKVLFPFIWVWKRSNKHNKEGMIKLEIAVNIGEKNMLRNLLLKEDKIIWAFLTNF